MSAHLTPLLFTVVAVPKPQGSKRAFMTKPGPDSGKTPKAVMTDSDKEPLKAFREAVRGSAINAKPEGFEPFTGPLTVVLAFALHKPKYAERGPRQWPIKKTAGDIDKLTRSVLDALTDAAVFGDDGQVVRLIVDKDYPGTAESGMQTSPGVRVLVQPRYSVTGEDTPEITYEEGTLL
ncbi:MAG TPA: RusA family crossover junction endodeoxyribonuclease [Kineosporiaceae bacterium]|nr:RusA family crossover junction endodeoxyribonuclease [Kineosporiaceae bacterium]